MTPQIRKILTFLAIIGTTPSLATSCGTEVQTRILNQMFNGYNRDIRPPPGDNATVVTANSLIKNILWVDEKIHQWNIDLFFRTEWEDLRLAYSKSVNGCPYFKYITISSPEGLAKLWKPNLYFTTEIEGSIHEVLVRNEVARIFPNGHVWYSSHVRITLFCTGAGSRAGEYVCPMALYPYGPTTDEIELQWLSHDTIQIDRSQILLENHIVGDITTHVETTVAESGLYSTLVALFHFVRKACLS